MKSTIKIKGFTLIELMVVVGILSLLAAIAIPAYRSYTRTALIQECTNEIAAIRLAQEEFFIEFNTYFGDGAVGIAAIELASRGLYNSSFTTPAAIAAANCTFRVDGPGSSTNNIATSYLITATGQNNLDATEVMTNGN